MHLCFDRSLPKAFSDKQSRWKSNRSALRQSFIHPTAHLSAYPSLKFIFEYSGKQQKPQRYY